MSTVRDLIAASMKEIGVLSQGETPSAQDASDALYILNLMITSWSNDNLIIPNRTRELFDLVSGQSSYTMGSGADFDTARPMAIEEIYLQTQDSSLTEYNVCLYTKEQWASIPVKTITSDIPVYAYVEGTYPNETINFYPVPSDTNKVVIYSKKALTNFSSLNDTILVQPGMETALMYNLAVRLAPGYGKEAMATTQDIARDSKAKIKRTNDKPRFLKSDPAVLERTTFNWRTGE